VFLPDIPCPLTGTVTRLCTKKKKKNMNDQFVKTSMLGVSNRFMKEKLLDDGMKQTTYKPECHTSTLRSGWPIGANMAFFIQSIYPSLQIVRA
jgi:hypothetical protein